MSDKFTVTTDGPMEEDVIKEVERRLSAEEASQQRVNTIDNIIRWRSLTPVEKLGVASAIVREMSEEQTNISEMFQRLGDLSEVFAIAERTPSETTEDIGFSFDNTFSFDTSDVLIGSAYKGVKSFMEVETEDFYCPTENYCVFKCLEKFLELKGLRTIDGNYFKFNTFGYNPYFEKKTRYLDAAARQLTIKKPEESVKDYNTRLAAQKLSLPPFVYINKDPMCPTKVKFTRLDNNHLKSNCPGFRIGLLEANHNTYHAVLLKHTNPMRVRQFEEGLKFNTNLTLRSEWSKLKRKPPKPICETVIIYDIETATLNTTIKSIFGSDRVHKQLIPHALAYKVIRLSINEKTRALQHIDSETIEVHRTYLPDISSTPDSPDYATVLETYRNSYKSSDLYDRWFVDIATRFPDLVNLENKQVQVFAHNGARFDNLYLKNAKNINFISQIKSGSMVKSIECKLNSCGSTIFNFKDTLPFSLMPLKEIAKTLKCAPKTDFDIVDWTISKYNQFYDSQDPATNWRKYMKQDVDTLAEVFIKLEEMYMKIGASLTRFLGLPGVAFNLMQNTCFSFSEMPTPKDPSMKALIKNAMYGGRVVAYKRHFSKDKNNGDVLICLDANSLYPSAMALGSFPIGVPHVLLSREEIQNLPDKSTRYATSVSKEDLLESLKQGVHKDGRSSIAPHFIATIKFKIPNIPQTLVPYRCEEGDELKGLIYPTNGVYEGSYNDVDIREMLIDGYEIIEIVNGIFWTKSEQLFNNLITDLFNQRIVLKREGNSMEYVYKIILNAMYGKLLEAIDSSSFFKSDEEYLCKLNEKRTQLLNGQFEIDKNLSDSIMRKPSHIGTYVLAYARAIMNQYIRKVGIENVYYTDTDSIYITKSSFENSGIKETLDLGGVKNDYGDAVYIEEAYFIDQKRYFLQKVDTKKEKARLEAIEKYGADSKEVLAIGDHRPISCKYVGLSFKDVVRNTVNGNGTNIGWTEEQKILIRNLYLEIINNYEQWTFDSFEDPKAIVKKIIVCAEKWSRATGGISILNTDIEYAIAPHKKGLYIRSAKYDMEYHSIGFDLYAEKVPLAKGSGDIAEYCKKFPATPYKMISNGTELRIKSVLPVTNAKVTGKFLFNPNISLASHPSINMLTYLYISPIGVKSLLYRFSYVRFLSEDEVSVMLSQLPTGTDPDIYLDSQGVKWYHYAKNSGAYGIERYRFFNTCRFGPTTEVEIPKSEHANLLPVFATDESVLLKNPVTDRTIQVIRDKVVDIVSGKAKPPAPRPVPRHILNRIENEKQMEQIIEEMNKIDETYEDNIAAVIAEDIHPEFLAPNPPPQFKQFSFDVVDDLIKIKALELKISKQKTKSTIAKNKKVLEELREQWKRYNVSEEDVLFVTKKLIGDIEVLYSLAPAARKLAPLRKQFELSAHLIAGLIRD